MFCRHIPISILGILPYFNFVWAGSEAQTRNLWCGRPSLYQLSYSRLFLCHVLPTELESAIFSVKGRCPNQIRRQEHIRSKGSSVSILFNFVFIFTFFNFWVLTGIFLHLSQSGFVLFCLYSLRTSPRNRILSCEVGTHLVAMTWDVFFFNSLYGTRIRFAPVTGENNTHIRIDY